MRLRSWSGAVVCGRPELLNRHHRVVVAAARAVGITLREHALHFVDEIGHVRAGDLARPPRPHRWSPTTASMSAAVGPKVACCNSRTASYLRARLLSIRPRARGQVSRNAPEEYSSPRPVTTSIPSKARWRTAPVHRRAGQRGQHDGAAEHHVVHVEVAVLAVLPGIVGEHHVHLRTGSKLGRGEVVVGRLGRLHDRGADHHTVDPHRHRRTDAIHLGAAGAHRQCHRADACCIAALPDHEAAGHRRAQTRCPRSGRPAPTMPDSVRPPPMSLLAVTLSTPPRVTVPYTGTVSPLVKHHRAGHLADPVDHQAQRCRWTDRSAWPAGCRRSWTPAAPAGHSGPAPHRWWSARSCRCRCRCRHRSNGRPGSRCR